ncbi:anaerobic benzoate catabolism transcriptional regulator [Gimesia panareensis]|nr:anaerobic benzoate catabolism transcriptional regulator [Gimesia panareensis]
MTLLVIPETDQKRNLAFAAEAMRDTHNNCLPVARRYAPTTWTNLQNLNNTYSPWFYRRCQVLNACMAKRADILVRFGQRVRELRKEQGYSQENFAYACELDRTYVGGIERGERNLSLRNIERIADTLEISLTELMEGV